jgi:CBS domain-containing protein
MGPLVWFSVIERVGTILEVLHTTKHNAFPVVDDGKNERPVFCGLVLRSHLLVLLKKKQFLERREQGGLQHDGTFSPAEFAKPGSGKGAKIHDIDLDIAEEEMFLDLHPVTNTSPYTVVETMSLAKAYTLFRQLGLRHLCVMPKSSEVYNWYFGYIYLVYRYSHIHVYTYMCYFALIMDAVLRSLNSKDFKRFFKTLANMLARNMPHYILGF